MSFDEQKIVDNVNAFIEQIRHVKPSAVKGHYIKSVTLSATMSPGIPLQV
jgi:large subunit ribosomal protein L1